MADRKTLDLRPDDIALFYNENDVTHMLAFLVDNPPTIYEHVAAKLSNGELLGKRETIVAVGYMSAGATLLKAVVDQLSKRQVNGS